MLPSNNSLAAIDNVGEVTLEIKCRLPHLQVMPSKMYCVTISIKYIFF